MARLKVEVIYAERGAQEIVSVDLEEGATALDALHESGLAAHHPGIEPGNTAIGIFGRCVPPETLLKEGDRVEIYRPLAVDPKEARRAKASAKSPRKRQASGKSPK